MHDYHTLHTVRTAYGVLTATFRQFNEFCNDIGRGAEFIENEGFNVSGNPHCDGHYSLTVTTEYGIITGNARQLFDLRTMLNAAAKYHKTNSQRRRDGEKAASAVAAIEAALGTNVRARG